MGVRICQHHWIQLRPQVKVIFLYLRPDAPVLLFFRLFTQVHLLIDGSVEGQYVTSLVKTNVFYAITEKYQLECLFNNFVYTNMILFLPPTCCLLLWTHPYICSKQQESKFLVPHLKKSGSFSIMYKFCVLTHHHHLVVPPAQISLTLSRHSSQSFIASGRSSGLHPVSSQSCCMLVWAGRPAFARPCEGVHLRTSLMSSSLLLQHVWLMQTK